MQEAIKAMNEASRIGLLDDLMSRLAEDPNVTGSVEGVEGHAVMELARSVLGIYEHKEVIDRARLGDPRELRLLQVSLAYLALSGNEQAYVELIDLDKRYSTDLGKQLLLGMAPDIFSYQREQGKETGIVFSRLMVVAESMGALPVAENIAQQYFENPPYNLDFGGIRTDERRQYLGLCDQHGLTHAIQAHIAKVQDQFRERNPNLELLLGEVRETCTSETVKPLVQGMMDHYEGGA